MKPRNLTACIALALLLPALRSQPQTARPQFDVASLKPNPGCENNRRGGNLSPSSGRLEMPCVTLQGLIQVRLQQTGDTGGGQSFRNCPRGAGRARNCAVGRSRRVSREFSERAFSTPQHRNLCFSRARGIS